MKKVFLMLAFAGLVGSVSASVKSTGDDDKDKKATKKEGKTCCKAKAGAEGKSCSSEKTTTTSDGKTTTIEKKTCCKSKTTADAKPTETK